MSTMFTLVGCVFWCGPPTGLSLLVKMMLALIPVSDICPLRLMVEPWLSQLPAETWAVAVGGMGRATDVLESAWRQRPRHIVLGNGVLLLCSKWIYLKGVPPVAAW